MYSEKNLISHNPLSEWTTTQSTTYMTYEEVTPAVAGTTGLPDSSAPIYRLENINLVPLGDFEGAASLAAAGWVESGGTNSITAAGHTLDNDAISFDLAETEYLEYDLNQMSDMAIAGDLYLFRYSFEGTTGSYYFETADTTVTENRTAYFPYIPASGSGTHLTVPDDFNEHSVTEFLIHSSDTDVFRINFGTDGKTQSGFFDNFRIIKSDQQQFLIKDVFFEDADRIDGLSLISGIYRFSVYVKIDTELATRLNSFEAKAVTLKIQSFDPDGTLGTIAQKSFDSSDNSSFSDWTNIYLDSYVQINTPSDTTQTAIRLFIGPTDTTGGAVTKDAGSILISTPTLLYSEDGAF